MIRILKNRRLFKKWTDQGGKSINYQELFKEQALNFGHFPKYRKHIVVWHGKINYCVRDVHGNITDFRLQINPSSYHFGENIIYCHIHKEATKILKTKHINDGDFVTVFGHLQEYEIQSFSYPRIIFSHIEKLN